MGKEKVRIENELNKRMGTGAETGMVEDCFIACDDEQAESESQKREGGMEQEGGEEYSVEKRG